MALDRNSRRSRGRGAGERAENVTRNRDDKGTFDDRAGFLKSEAELTKAGITMYQTASGKDGAAKLHSIHVLEPHPDDPNLVGLGLYGHRDVGGNGDAFLCPKEMRAYLAKQQLPIPPKIEDGRCPMCEHHEKLLSVYKKKKDKVGEKVRNQMWQELRKYRASSGKWNEPGPVKFLTWVVDATDRDTEDEGVKVFLMAPTIHDKGLVKFIKPSGDRKGKDPLDPDDGYIFEFEREGKEWHEIEYSGYGLTDRDPVPDEWMDAVPHYYDVLQFEDYDTIRAAMGTMTEADDDDEGDDTRRRNRDDEEEPRRRSRSSRRGRDEADEGDDTRRRSRSRSRDDDDPPAEEPRRREGVKDEVGDHFDNTNPKRDRDDGDDPKEEPRRRSRRDPDDDPPAEEPRRRSRRDSDDDPKKDDEPRRRSRDDTKDDEDDEVAEIRRRRAGRRAKDDNGRGKGKDDDEEMPY